MRVPSAYDQRNGRKQLKNTPTSLGVVVKSRLQQQLDLILGKIFVQLLPSSKWDILDILDIYRIYWIYCTYRKHTSCKMNYLDRDNAKAGGRVKFEILVANPIEKSRL